MSDRKRLIQEALRAAMEVREHTNRDISQPLCIYDVAAEMGIEVRFVSLPSVEGMYSGGDAPTIVIGAQRPVGRRAYTCAHELGHHVFGHGTRVDLLSDAEGSNEFIEEEFLAQTFAGFLLMPKLAVFRAMTNRGLGPATATPVDFFRIARYFGVGYSSLLQHLCGIGLITEGQCAELLKTKLQQVRREILPDMEAKSILPVDNAWIGRAVDAEVGEILITSANMEVEGNCLSTVPHLSEKLFLANKPGCCRLINPDANWAAYVRVSRAGYEGRSSWRHLEEEDQA
ncbi:MAG: ImmA/IrrE family metallo-endopeptidase [Opitutales bacterium]